MIYAAVTGPSGEVWVQSFAEGPQNGWQGWAPTYGTLQNASIAAANSTFFIAGRNPENILYWYRPDVGWTLLGYQGFAAGKLAASPQ